MCIGAEIPDIQGRIFQFEDASSTLIFQFSYFFSNISTPISTNQEILKYESVLTIWSRKEIKFRIRTNL